MSTSPEITVVGSINTDMVVRLPHLPQPGESVLGGNFLTAQGGKGANQAVAARRLGAEVTLVACVGDDHWGDASLEAIAQEGIVTDYIFREEGPSGIASIFVAQETGENCIAIAPGANDKLSSKHIERALPALLAADIILVQLEIPLATVAATLHHGHAAGKLTLLNPAPATQLDRSILANTKILTPNETEADYLTNMKISDRPSAQAAAEHILAQGLAQVVITLGAQGALGVMDNQVHWAPAPTVKAIDTTAAGDTFNGALATALAQGQGFQEALSFANIAAALSVTRLGAQSSLPTLQEVMEFQRQGFEFNQPGTAI